MKVATAKRIIRPFVKLGLVRVMDIRDTFGDYYIGSGSYIAPKATKFILEDGFLCLSYDVALTTFLAKRLKKK